MTSARMISQIMQQRFRRFGHGTWNLRNLFGNQRNHRNGQALVELAVFGSILLAALGFLLRVGMKMNYDQEIRMATFRRALAAAHADNGTDQDAMAVLYYYMSDRQMPDPGDGMMSLPRAGGRDDERQLGNPRAERGRKQYRLHDDHELVGGRQYRLGRSGLLKPHVRGFGAWTMRRDTKHGQWRGTRPPTNLALCIRQLLWVDSIGSVREAKPHAHGQVGGPSENKQVDRSHPVSGARPPTNCGRNRGRFQLVGGQVIVE